jgi:hypothetical protein
MKNLHFTLSEGHEVRKLLFPKLRDLIGKPMDEDAKYLMAGMKSLLNPQRNYEFRLVLPPTASAISANVVAGGTQLTPTGLAEWSGILDALFDEYRTDRLHVSYTPLIQSGSSTQWFAPILSVGTDFDSSPTPTSHTQVLTYADGRDHPVPLQSASAYFIQPLCHFVHVSHVPNEVAVAGSVASVEWLDVAQAWPGTQCYYADVIGANSITVFMRVAYYYVRMRVRK